MPLKISNELIPASMISMELLFDPNSLDAVQVYTPRLPSETVRVKFLLVDTFILLNVHVMVSGGSTPVMSQTRTIVVPTTTGRGWTVVTLGGTAKLDIQNFVLSLQHVRVATSKYGSHYSKGIPATVTVKVGHELTYNYTRVTSACCKGLTVYCIAGNFRGIQFSWKGNLQRFRDLIFADGPSRTAPPTIPLGAWLRLLPHAQRTAVRTGR